MLAMLNSGIVVADLSHTCNFMMSESDVLSHHFYQILQHVKRLASLQSKT
jgi:hypothetical protein